MKTELETLIEFLTYSDQLFYLIKLSEGEPPEVVDVTKQAEMLGIYAFNPNYRRFLEEQIESLADGRGSREAIDWNSPEGALKLISIISRDMTYPKPFLLALSNAGFKSSIAVFKACAQMAHYGQSRPWLTQAWQRSIQEANLATEDERPLYLHWIKTMLGYGLRILRI